jgi:hypothetical protein
MSAEGHFPGSTTNAHTRGPVLSLVTNWGEVLHQSVKLKLQHDKTINQLFASNETSLLLKLQPPTNSEKCGDFAHGFLRTGEVAANPSSVAPVEPAVPASNEDRTVFFQEPIRPIPFPISSNRFPCLFPFPLESLESNVAIGFFKKTPCLFLRSVSRFRFRSLIGIG